MKKSFVIIITCFSLLYAQNQGVGIGTLSPDASARLDVVATDKGILIPRVNLVATNNPAPVASPAVSLLVYNQATINDVVPGFYYWDGAKWVNLSAGVSNDAWLLNGNAGTNSATNFVGTTDAQAITFRTNNIPRFRIANGNQVYGLNGGSASSPFYSWESDANTGMFNPAADELAFSTNGSERVRISSVGNVGIGTTNPAAQFHTTGTVRFANYPSGANGALLRTNNFGDLAITNFTGNANEVLLGNGSFGPVPNNNDWKLDGNTNGVERYIGTNDNLDFPIRTNNTEKMRITTSGNVGIGTTTPTQLLHVSGGSILTNRAYAATTLDLVAAALINITQPATQVRITNVAGAQANAVNYTAAAIEGQYLWITNTDDNDATFAGATIPTNTAMGFVYTGGAWRAVSAPISGGNDWALLGNAGTNSATNFVGTTDAQALTFRTNNVERFRIANGNQVYALANGTANAPFYSWENDADMGLFRASVDELGFSTAGAERMRIAANGNVGIGTSTPNHQLHVVGNVRFEGDFVNQEIQGANDDAIQSIAYNASAVPINGTTISVTINDGNGVNNSGVLVTGFARIVNATTFTGNLSLAGYFLVLRRAEDPAFTVNPTICTYSSGICGLRFPSGLGNGTLGFNMGSSVTYADMNLTPGVTYYYRLELYGNCVGTNGGTLDVYERNLTLIQIKR